MSAYEDIFGAAREGTAEDVKYFIEKLGDTAHTTKGDSTLLHFAAASNPNVAVLEYLVSQGLDVNAQNGDSKTPLHRAAENNPNVAVLAYLISKGADVKAVDKDGLTPLHGAAESSANVEVLECLISKGAGINVKDNMGATPLHKAAECNDNTHVTRFLIAQKSDVNAKDNKGATPFDYANYTYKHCCEQIRVFERARNAGMTLSRESNSEAGRKRFQREAEEREVERQKYAAKSEGAQQRVDFLQRAGGIKGSGYSGRPSGGGCLVFIAALGTLLTSGVCGLALFVATAWRY